MNAQLAPTAHGIFPDVSWDSYLRLPGCSITRLKELRRSPKHYHYRLLNPKESAPLSLGRAAHCAVLEPDRFSSDHAVWERRTSGGNLAPRNGQWWEAFKAQNAGRTFINADEHADVLRIQAAVRGDADAMRYLGQGRAEVTLLWSVLGRDCKGRIDWLAEQDGRPVIVGLKTARDCRHYPFGSQAARLGYHLQWAYYSDGYSTLTGTIPKVVEIVVEPEPPHAVAVYVIPEDILVQGEEEYGALLERLDECEREKSWPGPVVGEQILTLPSWVYDRDEDLSDLELEK